ncbi:MAG: DNA polymerase III subunit delta [Johnsonella sp.]|nr:DNA polymerase III subunit delta [Johnsonella sp.]
MQKSGIRAIGEEMKQLNADIKNKSFQKTYLLYGEEDYLLRSYKNRLKQAMIGEDHINYGYFEGKSISESELINAALTLPFFSGIRCIIVENSGWFKSSHEEIVKLMERLPESTKLIFVEKEVDKRNRLYKRVKEIGYIAELSLQNQDDLANWAAGVLAKAGKKISRANMDLFLSYTGENMNIIASETEKLIAYVGDREVIERADIDSITTIGVNNRIFDMVRAISLGKRAEAMRLYEDLLRLREPALRILFLIARQFDQLLCIRELDQLRLSKEEMSRETGLKPYAVSKLLQQARGFEQSALEVYLRCCVELEESVKTGELPERLAVELLIAGYKESGKG